MIKKSTLLLCVLTAGIFLASCGTIRDLRKDNSRTAEPVKPAVTKPAPEAVPAPAAATAPPKEETVAPVPDRPNTSKARRAKPSDLDGF